MPEAPTYSGFGPKRRPSPGCSTRTSCRSIDVGEANGLPYLSLELCAGSLADRLDGTPWPPKPAAELVETLARAVEAAHQAGVLHRDIKPANVLMSGVRSQESGVRSQRRRSSADT
jgi:serine/threonine protein kinase